MPTGVQASVTQRWTSQTSWTVLDTGFAAGAGFLELWACWHGHPKRPDMLHYVGLLSLPEATGLAGQLHQAAEHNTPSAERATALAGLVYGLGTGFHRILLEGGQLSLTLCVGERSILLAQLALKADTLLAHSHSQDWDKWQLKALARCCKRGTQLVFFAPTPPLALLLDAGFQAQAQTDPATLQARYDPRWQLRSQRAALPDDPPNARPEAALGAGRCAVVGAGIAGSSVARALALRGWQVDVYDSQPLPAGGAAALPVGLVVPHHSSDDSARSRMSRAGTRLMLQHADQQLTLGQDWQSGGVLELHIAPEGLADVEAEVLSQATAQPTGWSSRQELGQLQGLWHPYAAWIKPARLVERWLAHPSIHFHGGAIVHSLQREGQQWLLHNDSGAELGRADRVVFANAHGCAALVQRLAAALPPDFAWIPDALEKLQTLQAIPGTLSMGPMPMDATALPAFPVNGHGSLVSNVPTAQGPQWFGGSTFQTDPALHADLAGEHRINLHKLQALLPQVAALLAPQFASAQVQAWQGTRCVTHDRLPLVGPLDEGPAPTLWLCAGMGARGLSFSALCAELLVAELCSEPLPLESSLARSLGTRRRRRVRPA